MYKIHSSKVSIIGDASCVGFDFLYIVAIFYDVNSLSGSLKYAELTKTCSEGQIVGRSAVGAGPSVWLMVPLVVFGEGWVYIQYM